MRVTEGTDVELAVVVFLLTFALVFVFLVATWGLP